MNTMFKNLMTLFTCTAFLLSSGFVMAQDMPYAQLEEKQDEIEKLSVKIFDFYNNYPEFAYTYVYDDEGNLESVDITGINDTDDRKNAELYLMDLAELRADIENQANRVNVYYVTETMPKPRDGYEELYDNLYAEVDYPERAIDNNIEGTVFVRFIIDDEGEILHTNATHNIDSNNKYLVNEMVEEAKEAVKSTSGNWIPGKVGNIPVTNWRMLPIEYSAEQDPATRPIF